MNHFSKTTLLCICASLTPAAPVMADDDTTAVMQELFDVYWASIGTPEIGSVDDARRSTRWNDVTVKGTDDGPVANLAWIEVSKKLLGGYSVTMAEEVTISGELPDGDGEISGSFTSEGFGIDVSGSASARAYDMTFSQISGVMSAGDLFEMEMQMNAGSSQSTVANEIIKGTFDYPKVDIQYKINVEGQSSDVAMSMADMKGKYRSPVLGGTELKHYKKLWNADESFFADYTISGMVMDMKMQSPAGPVSVNATTGAYVGRMAATEGVVSSGGQAVDVVYNVSAMGMPPMKVTVDEISSRLAVPLDNVGESKQASIQLAMTGLDLDPMIWAMFDPQGNLSKDKANLEIDLSADMKWAQKMEAFDVTQLATGLPVQFEDVKINALNLNALGAELRTDGAFEINTSKFPPEASGVANVSVKGVNDLMGKLTQAGLLPIQNAMMAKGMMGVFFKQGGEGLDHLTSQIMVAPNGSITANGIPLK
jgi:hypothetical protein